MARILYLHRDPSFARFIQDDLAFLSTRHEVDDVRAAGDAATAEKLARALVRADLVYAWWGDLTGLGGLTAATLLRKKSVLVTGGHDVADVPEIGYGLKHDRVRRFFPAMALRLATRVLANSENARREARMHVPLGDDKVRVIHHGVDATIHTPGDVAKERRVLTVSMISKPYVPYKGLRTFVEAARLLPDVPFVHAGPDKNDGAMDELRKLAPPNVTFLGFMSEEGLVHEMRRATVYAQLSAHEGFGMALAEAMLTGATPVVTPKGAIPEVAGDVAYYAAYGHAASTADAIRRALDTPRGAAARARIQTLFPPEKRRDAVLALVDEALAAPA
ncbi:glycosyltransferase [Myxococcota bacterium]|nr:glycosyltransferase [Myxococcota bacterium]